MNDTIWFGSREFLSTTVVDDDTQPATTLTSYDVAILPFTSRISDASWVAVTSYAGERGIWADGLAAGSYRVFARVGPGAPNERTIVALGFVNVRNR